MLHGAAGIPAAATGGARPSKNWRVRKRQRPDPQAVRVTVPVAFNRHLGCGDAAFVLAQLLRHVLFMRGQLPMPYHQLLQVLNEREEQDDVTREEKAAAAAAAARAFADTGGSEEGGNPAGPGRCSSNNRSKRAKSGRLLARAPAHRRARKGLGALDETTRAMEEAFADTAVRGRPVLEALILFGASHLSPREIYSVTFSQPSPDEGSSQDEDVIQGGEQEGDATTSRSAGGGTGSVRGRSSLADAYSRKVVRTLVGELSSVEFRRIGSCRVHIFLRIADVPGRDPHSAQRTRPTVDATAAASSIAGNANTASESGRSGSNTSNTSNDNNNTRALNNHALVDPSPHLRVASPVLPPASPPAAPRRLVPRPRFKIRVSRSRPAPQASIVLSKRPPVPPRIASQPHCGGAVGAELGETRGQQPQPQQQPDVNDGPRSTAAAAQYEQEHGCHLQQRAEGELERGWAEDERVRLQLQQEQQSQQQSRGVWHQLVCARFAGLKGCDSLAS